MSVSVKYYLGAAVGAFAVSMSARTWIHHETPNIQDTCVVGVVSIMWPITGTIGICTLAYELITDSKVAYSVDTRITVTKN